MSEMSFPDTLTYSVKALQENPVVWSSFVYRHGISTAGLTNSVKALKEAMMTERESGTNALKCSVY